MYLPLTRLLRLTALVAVTAIATACATSAFDREFEAGHLAEAARIFAADSSLWHNERALFRDATARATPGSPIYDPGQARVELQAFLARFPRSSRRADALRLDSLLAQLERLSQRNRSLAHRADSLAARADSASTRAAEQRRAATRLQAELRRTEAELHAVQQELERLKAIDLRLSKRKSPYR